MKQNTGLFVLILEMVTPCPPPGASRSGVQGEGPAGARAGTAPGSPLRLGAGEGAPRGHPSPDDPRIAAAKRRRDR